MHFIISIEMRLQLASLPDFIQWSVSSLMKTLQMESQMCAKWLVGARAVCIVCGIDCVHWVWQAVKFKSIDLMRTNSERADYDELTGLTSGIMKNATILQVKRPPRFVTNLVLLVADFPEQPAFTRSPRFGFIMRAFWESSEWFWEWLFVLERCDAAEV